MGLDLVRGIHVFNLRHYLPIYDKISGRVGEGKGYADQTKLQRQSGEEQHPKLKKIQNLGGRGVNKFTKYAEIHMLIFPGINKISYAYGFR